MVHTLNYLSHDYKGAVKNGEIISKSEYHEMQEFGESAIKYFKEISHEWSAQDSIAIGIRIYHIDSLIGKHAPYEMVSPYCVETKNKIIAISGLRITPVVFPSIDNGKVVFKTECAKCHGDNGFGDGLEGKDLSPRPRNFHDNEKMSSLSPFFVFNTVRLGVEGTGMKEHPELEDNDVWDVAFYVLTLRYQQYKDDPFLKAQKTKAFLDSLTVEKVSVTSDDEFLKSLSLSDTLAANLWLAAIRYNHPATNSNEFINLAIRYLDGAMQLYKDKKYADASKMATSSYLEGIEPIEMQLKSNNPQLMSDLEEQIQRLGKLMEQQRPAIDIRDSINAAKRSVRAASELLSKKEYSFLMALLLAISILLREGLEAFLVILVILSILKASQLKNAAKWVHAGWVTAVLFGVVIWLVSGKLISSQVENMELLEGIISLVAVALLLYVGFWLHAKSEIGKWKDYVSKMMRGAVKSESMIGLAFLSFIVVFREVFESVLFLSALNIESGAKQSNAIVLGIFIA
ncbi:MAG: high-affinity Fe2+/Pb2+ permease, partial [Bacteroidota bacterium]|nr:high-affinity Fe2+/Pb2+ permease [Bacteroidota bacterium]